VTVIIHETACSASRSTASSLPVLPTYVSFLVSDASKMLDQARLAVAADARRKAEIYTKAAGVQLGRAEWIMEHTSNGSPVPMLARTSNAAADREP
jgi:uncharacterized protein YggE